MEIDEAICAMMLDDEFTLWIEAYFRYLSDEWGFSHPFMEIGGLAGIIAPILDEEVFKMVCERLDEDDYESSDELKEQLEELFSKYN